MTPAQMSAKAQLLAHKSETGFMLEIVREAKAHDWLTYHTFDSRRSDPGFPDLTMIRGFDLLALEVKTETGTTSDEQEVWLDAFGRVREVTSATVRPHQWDALVRRLRAPANGAR